jgi:hypothetical protein
MCSGYIDREARRGSPAGLGFAARPGGAHGDPAFTTTTFLLRDIAKE